MSALYGAAGAWLVTVAITPLTVRALQALGLLDVPNERSSHSKVTPRGGGVAVLVGAAAGLLVLRPTLDAALTATLAGAALIGAVGLLDDRFGLPMWVRFLAHVVAGVGLIVCGGSLVNAPLPAPGFVPLGPWGPALTLLWILVVTNAFNFMDGIDGLASLQAVVTCALIAFAGAGGGSGVGAALAGASAGFLVYNWSPARVFLGDVGSGALGFLVASLPLTSPSSSRSSAVLLVAISLGLFCGDAAYSRVRRVWHGQNLFAPHREHLYQRLVLTGVSHARVTTGLGLGAVLLAALALLAQQRGPGTTWLWLVAGLIPELLALEALWLRRRERAANASTTHTAV
jgi:Fuc2NAc and GlcNAc transferase